MNVEKVPILISTLLLNSRLNNCVVVSNDSTESTYFTGSNRTKNRINPQISPR